MTLYDFANCGRFDKKINQLANLATTENWGKPKESKENPVLHNYISHYFRKVYDDDLIVYSEKEDGTKIACFNTGLLTPHFDDIYAYFKKIIVVDKIGF